MDIRIVAAICFAFYLLGSIPFGLIVGLWANKKRIDIRVGGGNIGATNAGRRLGFKYGVFVASLDIWKSAVSVILIRYLSPKSWWLIGLAWLSVFLGHLFPPWLKFKGGKGVSVFVGGLIGLLDWKICLILLLLWLIGLFLTRKMSANNLIFGGVVILLSVLAIPALVLLSPVVAIIVLLMCWAHRENLKRLRGGVEPDVKLPSLRGIIIFVADKVRLFVGVS